MMMILINSNKMWKNNFSLLNIIILICLELKEANVNFVQEDNAENIEEIII
jgi:hypothetical protein